MGETCFLTSTVVISSSKTFYAILAYPMSNKTDNKKTPIFRQVPFCKGRIHVNRHLWAEAPLLVPLIMIISHFFTNLTKPSCFRKKESGGKFRSLSSNLPGIAGCVPAPYQSFCFSSLHPRCLLLLSNRLSRSS